jgi:hypothetical protein
VIIWVTDGFLSAREFAGVTEAPPPSTPEIKSIRLMSA